MKNHTFVLAMLIVEMTCNITKLTAILQVLPSKTFDIFFKNDFRKCALGGNLRCKAMGWCTMNCFLHVFCYNSLIFYLDSCKPESKFEGLGEKKHPTI